MAFFGVTVEKIEKVWQHSNADSSDLAKLEGMSFQFVVGKGSMKPGDIVVYFHRFCFAGKSPGDIA